MKNSKLRMAALSAEEPEPVSGGMEEKHDDGIKVQIAGPWRGRFPPRVGALLPGKTLLPGENNVAPHGGFLLYFLLKIPQRGRQILKASVYGRSAGYRARSSTHRRITACFTASLYAASFGKRLHIKGGTDK